MKKMNFESVMEYVLYVIFAAGLVLLINLTVVSDNKTAKMEASCKAKNSYLIDGSSGPYCFVPGKGAQ
jgi:hypothetical protein